MVTPWQQSAGTTSYTTNSLYQYTNVSGTTHVSDSNGNLTDNGTLLFEYDYKNLPVYVPLKSNNNLVVTYKYDALGRRVEKDLGSNNKERYVYFGIETIATYNAFDTWKQDFVYAQGIDRIVMLEQADVLNYDSDQNTAEVTRSYYHRNALGSVMEITGANQATVVSYCYDPYGTVTITRGGQVQNTDPLGMDEDGPSQGPVPGSSKKPGGFSAEHNRDPYYVSPDGNRFYWVLDLYFWFPEGARRGSSGTPLWVRSKVVEQMTDLKKWIGHSNTRDVPDPEAKETVEYWLVGNRRTNTHDWWYAAQAYCAGRIVMTMTVQFGHLNVKKADGTWAKFPRNNRGYTAFHILESAHGYEPDEEAIGSENTDFEPLGPSRTWTYEIKWDFCPRRCTKQDWSSLALPEEFEEVRPATSRRCPITPSEPATPR